MNNFNTIIVGQGLAGTTLAWALHMRGQRILLIDRDDAVTASRIAAGLVTPITGKRLAKSWRLDEFDPFAERFYGYIEAILGTSFYKRILIDRLFQSDWERTLYHERQTQLRDLVGGAFGMKAFRLNHNWFVMPYGGFTMPTAARLEVQEYLDQSRCYFEENGEYSTMNLNIDNELSLVDNGVSIIDNRLSRTDNELSADRIILCQGMDIKSNRWFSNVAMDPAKGEVLTIRIPGLHETRIINSGVWLAPLGDELFRVGSTYHRQIIDNVPSPEGRDEIVQKLEGFLRRPFEIVEHHAAVRPISSARVPIVGLHPEYPQIGIFNGLGSKGTLQAPYFAEQFADFLLGHGTIDNAVSLTAHLGNAPQTHKKRIVDVAQDEVRAMLKPGEVAIDATVGNGHDTHFLAEIAGVVHGFDIQPSAIDQVRPVVSERVILHCRSHAEMGEIGLEPRSVAAIMFNLGYLPGSDKSVTTQVDSTLAAIDSALSLLQPFGILTVLAYRGHAGGEAEFQAVRELLRQRDVTTREILSNPASAVAPVLFVVRNRS